jgi:uncharacterized protein (UPF0548 family)
VPILATRPSAQRPEAMLEAARREPAVTYSEVGATRGGVLPAGYRHDRAAVEVGQGVEVWGRTCEAVRRWEGHRANGATITPARAPLQPGSSILVTFRIGILFAVVPCRLVTTRRSYRAPTEGA